MRPSASGGPAYLGPKPPTLLPAQEAGDVRGPLTCPLQLLDTPHTPATDGHHQLLRTRLKLDNMDEITPFLPECFSFLQSKAGS